MRELIGYCILVIFSGHDMGNMSGISLVELSLCYLSSQFPVSQNKCKGQVLLSVQSVDISRIAWFQSTTELDCC